MTVGLASFPIFARLLPVREYGLMNLVVQTVLIFTVLSKAGLQNSIQRFELELTRQSDDQRQSFFTTAFLGNAIITLAVIAIFATGVFLIPSGWLPPTAKTLLWLGAGLIFARAARSMYGNMLQVEGKTITLNVIEVTVKLVSAVVICVLALRWQRSAMAFILGMAVVEVAGVGFLVPDFVRRAGASLKRFDAALFRRFAVFGLPLMWAELAWVILDSGDRFLVQFFRGSEAVGYYSAAYNVAMYTQEFVLMPLNLSFFPVCIDLWTNHGEEKTKEFLSRTLSYFALLAIGLIAMTVVVADDVIILAASAKYLQAKVLLPWLVAGLTICALQVFFRACLLLRHQPTRVAHATTIAAVFNIVLNLWLIPAMGTLGAAISTFLAYALWILLMARAAFSVLAFPVDYRAIAKYVLAGVAVLFSVRELHFQSTIIELLVRGTVGCGAYLLLALLLDSRLRQVALARMQRKAAPEPLVQTALVPAPDSQLAESVCDLVNHPEVAND